MPKPFYSEFKPAQASSKLYYFTPEFEIVTLVLYMNFGRSSLTVVGGIGIVPTYISLHSLASLIVS